MDFDAKMEAVKVLLGGLATAFFKMLGVNYKIVIVLMCFMVADTVLGWLGAAKKGEWKSKNARWGAVGKLVELIIIALMYLCEWAFDVSWLISTVTIYFILCEGASIVENIVQYHLNDNVPTELVEILTKAKGSVVSAIVKKIKKLFESDKGKEDE
jgi:toxin secretion/phage lysis holin